MTSEDDYAYLALSLRVTCRSCPFQIEGTVNGRSLYYRERGSHWTLQVGAEGADLNATVLDGAVVASGTGVDTDDLATALFRIGTAFHALIDHPGEAAYYLGGEEERDAIVRRRMDAWLREKK